MGTTTNKPIVKLVPLALGEERQDVMFLTSLVWSGHLMALHSFLCIDEVNLSGDDVGPEIPCSHCHN